MNIFEQYGIKEVADVCLYAIELDENDDEVYVPVLYLDTLNKENFTLSNAVKLEPYQTIIATK